MPGIVLPNAAKTADDKAAFCYRALERLRLWHNERGALVRARKLNHTVFREWQRVEYKPRSRAVFERLNPLRDQLDRHADPFAHEALAAGDRQNMRRNAGTVDGSWDQWIDPRAIPPLGAREPLPDPLENFETFDETDTTGVLTVDSPSKVSVFAGARSVNWWIKKDYGLDHFTGDYAHRFNAIETRGASGGILGAWLLSNSSGDGDFYDHYQNGYPCNYIRLSTTAAANRIVLIEVTAPTTQYTDLYDDTQNTRRYYEASRDMAVGAAGTLFLDVYSDAGFSALVAGLSVALHGAGGAAWQYLSVCSNYGDVNGSLQDGDVQDLDLQEAAAGVPTQFMHYQRQRKGA